MEEDPHRGGAAARVNDMPWTLPQRPGQGTIDHVFPSMSAACYKSLAQPEHSLTQCDHGCRETGPCFPKASLAYVVREVHRTVFRPFPESIVSNERCENTRSSQQLQGYSQSAKSNRYNSLGGVISWTFHGMCFIKTHPIPRNVRNTPKTVVTTDILLIDYC